MKVKHPRTKRKAVVNSMKRNHSQDYKFVVAYENSDVEILTQNGFKLAGVYTNNTMKRTEYLFVNRPELLLTFNLSNMKLGYTNQLMFSK